jgi:hypothetical protein
VRDGHEPNEAEEQRPCRVPRTSSCDFPRRKNVESRKVIRIKVRFGENGWVTAILKKRNVREELRADLLGHRPMMARTGTVSCTQAFMRTSSREEFGRHSLCMSFDLSSQSFTVSHAL